MYCCYSSHVVCCSSLLRTSSPSLSDLYLHTAYSSASCEAYSLLSFSHPRFFVVDVTTGEVTEEASREAVQEVPRSSNWRTVKGSRTSSTSSSRLGRLILSRMDRTEVGSERSISVLKSALKLKLKLAPKL